MANIIFSGTVSAQAQAGEPVTITVTKPDNTTETLTAQTLADMTYSTNKVYTEVGNYKVTAHGDKVETPTTEYSAWDTPEASFVIKTIVTRTGTLTVVLG